MAISFKKNIDKFGSTQTIQMFLNTLQPQRKDVVSFKSFGLNTTQTESLAH